MSAEDVMESQEEKTLLQDLDDEAALQERSVSAAHGSYTGRLLRDAICEIKRLQSVLENLVDAKAKPPRKGGER